MQKPDTRVGLLLDFFVAERLKINEQQYQQQYA
jgi:hypothetical protein